MSDRPDPITPDGDGRRDRARIRFIVSEAADVTVSIVTKRGRLVRRILNAHRLGSGSHEARWSGRGRSGRPVRAGTYVYRISAVDSAGNAARTVKGTIKVRGSR